MRHLEAREIVAGDRRIGAVYQESEAPVFRCGLQLCWSPTQVRGTDPGSRSAVIQNRRQMAGVELDKVFTDQCSWESGAAGAGSLGVMFWRLSPATYPILGSSSR